jgi:DNA-binding GntR family transcriptional regulator
MKAEPAGLGGRAPIPRTLADSAAAILHEAILTGEFAPGERLRIEDLAARLSMSPMPIREALRELDARGLVIHTPHRGAKVAELSVEDLQETTEIRLALETLAVAHAADRFTDEDAKLAAGHLDAWYRAKRAKDVHDARIAHASFHFALYSAAESRWLLRSIRPVWENGERYRLESVDDRATLKQRMQEHERILKFCVEHRPDDAADELYNHLALTANLVAKKLGADELFEYRPRPKD